MLVNATKATKTRTSIDQDPYSWPLTTTQSSFLIQLTNKFNQQFILLLRLRRLQKCSIVLVFREYFYFLKQVQFVSIKLIRSQNLMVAIASRHCIKRRMRSLVRLELLRDYKNQKVWKITRGKAWVKVYVLWINVTHNRHSMIVRYFLTFTNIVNLIIRITSSSKTQMERILINSLLSASLKDQLSSSRWTTSTKFMLGFLSTEMRWSRSMR